MKLNERLKELREEKKYSQAYVADRLNVSWQAISKWENGWTSPDVDNLILLSELYGVQLEELTQFYYENHNDLKKESQNVSKEEPQKISLENNILLISITAIISTFIPFGGSIFCVWIFIKLWKKKTKIDTCYTIGNYNMFFDQYK